MDKELRDKEVKIFNNRGTFKHWYFFKKENDNSLGELTPFTCTDYLLDIIAGHPTIANNTKELGTSFFYKVSHTENQFIKLKTVIAALEQLNKFESFSYLERVDTDLIYIQFSPEWFNDSYCLSGILKTVRNLLPRNPPLSRYMLNNIETGLGDFIWIGIKGLLKEVNKGCKTTHGEAKGRVYSHGKGGIAQTAFYAKGGKNWAGPMTIEQCPRLLNTKPLWELMDKDNNNEMLIV